VAKAGRKTGSAQRKPWKQNAADPARLDALLDAAAVELNARGIAGASLAAIAQQIGVKRAALYYYFDSREDLAYRCYLRACRRTADDLAAARAAPDGLARVIAYLRSALDAKRAPAVVLSDIARLAAPYRGEVERAHAANIAALQALIDGGIADGSIRACDTQIVAQALFGMLSWVPLAGEWVAGSGAAVRRQAADAVCDLVSNGVAADAGAPFHCQIDVGQFAFRPVNSFDRKALAEQKVELLLQTASGLFNRRGIDGTSLDDITAALGATKGAFYQYLDDKRDLVVRCVQRAFDLYERFADAAEQGGRNGMERAFIGLHLNVQAQASLLSPLSPLTGLEALPPRALKRIRERSTQVEARFETFGRAGIRDGSLRRYDVRTLALAGTGAFGWIPKWHDPSGARTPRAIADEIVALFARGLRR
jgi:AcrR family transcriptional regulator